MMSVIADHTCGLLASQPGEDAIKDVGLGRHGDKACTGWSRRRSVRFRHAEVGTGRGIGVPEGLG